MHQPVWRARHPSADGSCPSRYFDDARDADGWDDTASVPYPASRLGSWGAFNCRGSTPHGRDDAGDGLHATYDAADDGHGTRNGLDGNAPAAHDAPRYGGMPMGDAPPYSAAAGLRGGRGRGLPVNQRLIEEEIVREGEPLGELPVTVPDEILQKYLSPKTKVIISALPRSGQSVWLRDFVPRPQHYMRLIQCRNGVTLFMKPDMTDLRTSKPVALFDKQVCTHFIHHGYCSRKGCLHTHRTEEQVKTVVACRHVQLKAMTKEQRAELLKHTLESEEPPAAERPVAPPQLSAPAPPKESAVEDVHIEAISSDEEDNKKGTGTVELPKAPSATKAVTKAAKKKGAASDDDDSDSSSDSSDDSSDEESSDDDTDTSSSEDEPKPQSDSLAAAPPPALPIAPPQPPVAAEPPATASMFETPTIELKEHRASSDKDSLSERSHNSEKAVKEAPKDVRKEERPDESRHKPDGDKKHRSSSSHEHSHHHHHHHSSHHNDDGKHRNSSKDHAERKRQRSEDDRRANRDSHRDSANKAERRDERKVREDDRDRAKGHEDNKSRRRTDDKDYPKGRDEDRDRHRDSGRTRDPPRDATNDRDRPRKRSRDAADRDDRHKDRDERHKDREDRHKDREDRHKDRRNPDSPRRDSRR